MLSKKIETLTIVNTFSRMICPYERPELGGAVLPKPLARRASTSVRVSPCKGFDATGERELKIAPVLDYGCPKKVSYIQITGARVRRANRT